MERCTILYIHLSTLPRRIAIVLTGNLLFVGKQGERGEAKLSTRQTRLETRWREMKEIKKSETREEGKNPSTSRYTLTLLYL